MRIKNNYELKVPSFQFVINPKRGHLDTQGFYLDDELDQNSFEELPLIFC